MMDNLVKEVLESEDTAKRDEKLLDVLNFVSQRITTRTDELEKHVNEVNTDISEAFCRLNNEECLVKIHENTHLLPLAVVEPDTTEASDNAETSSEASKPTLPEFIFQAVQTGMDVINRRQICIDVQSNVDYTGETMRVYEDVNPYIVRPLPPLIASREFYSPDFPKKKTIPIDPNEVTVDVPTVAPTEVSQAQPSVSEVQSAPPTSLPTAVPPPPPPAPPPPPTIAVISVPSSPAPVRVEQPEPPVIEATQPLEIPESVAASSRSISLQSSPAASISEHSPVPLTTEVPVVVQESAHKVHSRMPANLAEVIRNGPTPRKPQPVPPQTNEEAVFEDSKSDGHDVVQSVVNSTHETVVPSTDQPAAAPLPVEPEIEAPKPQAAPRKKISSAPKPVPRSRAPTVAQSQPPPQVRPVPAQNVHVPVVSEVVNKVAAAPVRPKVVQQRKKVSIFSSSSDDDDESDSTNHVAPVVTPTVVQNGTTKEAPVPKPTALPTSMVKMAFPTTGTAKTDAPPRPPSTANTQRKVSSRKLFDDSDDDDFLVTSKKNTSKPTSASTAPLPNQSRVPPTDLTNTQQRVVTKPVARKSMFSSSDSD